MAKNTRLKSAAVRNKGGGVVKKTAPVSPAPLRGMAGLGNCRWAELRLYSGWRLWSYNVGV